jgi:hypothetical protein
MIQSSSEISAAPWAVRRSCGRRRALELLPGGNPDRLTSEASFAALCGVSPIRRFKEDPPVSAEPGR